jgi:hypothetical protein
MPKPVREILEQFARLDPPVFIMGGFAEEVLLGDSLDRPHKDLDLLARRDELTALTTQLEALGLGPFQVVLSGSDEQPLLLRGQAGGLELELYVARPEPDGYSFEVPAQGPAGRLRLFMPADTFAYPATPRDGLAIHTLSPLALAHMRAASAQTRHLAAASRKHARDLAMLARLRETFLATRTAEQLQPRIEPVASDKL